MVIITRKNAPFVGGLDDLHGWKVAFVQKVITYEWLKRDQIPVVPVFVKTLNQELEAVSLGKADASIENLAAASYIIQHDGYINLKIAAPTSYGNYKLYFGVRKDWPILVSIINKTLPTISAAQHTAIRNQWIQVRYEHGLKPSDIVKWVMLVLGLALPVIFFVSLWNRRLKKEIDQRIKTEMALKDSETSYKTLAENLPGLAFRLFLRENYRIRFFNHMVLPLTGYTETEFKNRSGCPIVANIHPEDIQFVDKTVKKAIKANITYDVEYRYTRKDDQIRFFIERGKPIYDPDGKPLFIDGVIMDITERKTAENERMALEKKLARTNKMQALGLLAGGVAHDLNNILSILINYPELLMLNPNMPSEFKDPLKRIKDGGQRAAAVVEDLLTIARGVAITKKVANLNSIIKDYLASDEHHYLMKSHPDVKFIDKAEKDLLNINCSPIHIRKALINLVKNASEAIDDNGQVTISTRNQYVDRPIRGYDQVLAGEYAVLEIKDNGPGILPEDLERIFEPFYSRKVMGRSGTGLGLSIVYNTVQDHLGYIDVISDQTGTVFKLYFPVTRQELPNQSKIVSLGEYKGNGQKILVIDDELSQREIACQLLETLGYKCESEPSGEKAIDRLRQETFDLIVLDMLMEPGLSGRQTYQRIIDLHPGQKAIIASGFAETQDVRETQKLGAGSFLKKPYTIEKLGETVQRALQ